MGKVSKQNKHKKEDVLKRRIKGPQFSAFPSDVQNMMLEELQQESKKEDKKFERMFHIILTLIGAITFVLVIAMIIYSKTEHSDSAIKSIVLGAVGICGIIITRKTDGVAAIIKNMHNPLIPQSSKHSSVSEQSRNPAVTETELKS